MPTTSAPWRRLSAAPSAPDEQPRSRIRSAPRGTRAWTSGRAVSYPSRRSSRTSVAMRRRMAQGWRYGVSPPCAWPSSADRTSTPGSSPTSSRSPASAPSARGRAIQPPDGAIEVTRLRSPADLLRPLPSLARAGVLHFGGSPDYLVGLERALRGYDIAHVAELSNPYSLQAIRARRSGACERVVATVWENIALPAAANGVVARRARAVAEGLDACIAISEDARLHLELAGVPPERIEVFPMGIDLERFAPARGGAEGGPLRIVSVCRLVSEKGVEDLVVALRLLRDRERGRAAHARGQRSAGGAAARDGRGAGAGRARAPARRRPLLRGARAARRQRRVRAGQRAARHLARAVRLRGGRGDGRGLAGAGRAQRLAGRGGGRPGRAGHAPRPGRAGRAPGTAGRATRSCGAGAAPRNRARAEERYDRRRVAERIAGFYERVLAMPPRR